MVSSDDEEERPEELGPNGETMIQLGPGKNNDFDLDEINAYLERGQDEDRPPEPKDDKLRAMAVPHIAIFNQAKMRKDEANEFLKASKFEEALQKYHRGIWLLMDGDENFRGEKDGVTKASIGRGKGTNHFANADLALRDKVDELRVALHSNMSLCALKLKKYQVAMIAAEFCTHQNIQNVKALYRLAQACEGLTEWKQGLDALGIILDLEPENAAAKDMQIRMSHEFKKEKKKEKAKYSGMFSRIKEEADEGEVLYKPEDLKAESERTRAARRKEEIKQGQRRWVLNLPEMTPWEREVASRRFQTASEGEDVSKMAEGLPSEALVKIKEMFAAGIAKEEIEAFAFCEHLCCKLFTPDSRTKLREMLEEKPDMSKLGQAAVRLAVEDSAFLGEDTIKEALQLIEEEKLEEAWDLLKKKRQDYMFELHLTILPGEEAANLKELRELEEDEAPVEQIEPLVTKAVAMQEARIRRSLTEQGQKELKKLEDGGASKEELKYFFDVCDRGFFDEVMAAKYKEFQQKFKKIFEAFVKEQEATKASSIGENNQTANSTGPN